MKSRADFVWTDDAIKLLRFLIESEKNTAAQAAEAMTETFGVEFTRNAVIGKCRRMGFKFATADNGSENRVINHRAKKAKPMSLSAAVVDMPPPVRRPPLPVCAEVAPLVASDPVSFDSLRHHHCRWPIGDGPFLYCGADKGGHRSYCQEHRLRAYVRPVPKAKPAKTFDDPQINFA